jgi:hypothetical protein
MAAPPAPFSSFRELYLDNSCNEDHGDTTPLMMSFQSNLTPIVAPNNLFIQLGGEEAASTKAFLLLEQDPVQPFKVKSDVTKQYLQGLGQPPNQWTDQVFAFMGDVQHRNAPTTIEVPNTVFQRVGHGAAVRVFSPKVIIWMLLADPTMLAVDGPRTLIPIRVESKQQQLINLYQR